MQADGPPPPVTPFYLKGGMVIPWDNQPKGLWPVVLPLEIGRENHSLALPWNEDNDEVY